MARQASAPPHRYACLACALFRLLLAAGYWPSASSLSECFRNAYIQRLCAWLQPGRRGQLTPATKLSAPWRAMARHSRLSPHNRVIGISSLTSRELVLDWMLEH
jgi:hypothetical protein